MRSLLRCDRTARFGNSAFHDRMIAAACVALLQLCPNRSGGIAALTDATASSSWRTARPAVTANAVPASVNVR